MILCIGFILKRMLLAAANINLSNATLRLLSSKAQGCKDFLNSSKPCHDGILWIALAEFSQMSTMCQGFSHYLGFLHHFVFAKFKPPAA